MRFAYTLLLLSLIPALPGCRERREPPDAPRPARRSTTTAPPAEAPPEKVTTRYDPGADPANKRPGGFDLSRTRSPADPRDARRKPFTIEELYRLPTVGHPRWSPDGRRILFTVTRYDLEHGKKNSDIYRVDADGGDLRRMTRHESSDSSPAWAPDGRSFYFLSSRSDGTQIWRMPVDGGEPDRVSNFPTGVESYALARDGSRLAFATRVFPEHGVDGGKSKETLARIEKSTVQAYIADELLYRHWTTFKDGRRSHIMVLDVGAGEGEGKGKGKRLRDVTPGDFESPAFSLGDRGFSLSPDGGELCFSSNREPASARAWTTNTDLWVVPTRGGKAVNLTGANRGHEGSPAYSPDGRHVAYLRQEIPGYESDRPRLSIYERRTGKVRVLTEGLDNWVVDLGWSRDGRSIVFKTAVKGRFPLFRVDLADGRIRRLGLPSVRAFDVGPAGRLAFVFERIGMPSELYVADAEGQGVRRLTFLSREVAQEFDIRPAQELWLEGAGGRKVHTFLVKPHGFRPGRRYPLIINVHGGPQYQWDDRFRGDWQVYPGAGYVVAFFNPHGSIGYGQAYTAAISKDWGGKVYEDVMKVTDGLARLPCVDPKRVGAMGWSYGGYMMDWLLGHTDRFRALASTMGLYDLVSFYGGTEELWFPEWDLGGPPWSAAEAYHRWSPSSYAARFRTPTLIISGMKDFRVPYTQSLQLHTALRRQGVPARLVLFRNDGHWPSYVKSMPLYYAAHLDWFHRYLGGAPSPLDVRKLARGELFHTD